MSFRYFAILGAMRSGSNLLEQSLNQFTDLACYGEMFNPNFIGQVKTDEFSGITLAEREKNPAALIDAMTRQSDAKIAGFRFFNDHDPRVLKMILDDAACAKIILQRDPLQSFISLQIARKSDQWLLHNAPDRRGSKIIFDPVAYQDYVTAQAAYYADIRISLQTSGQTAFWLHYPEQKDIGTLNGLAKFIGSRQVLKSVTETIKRQNPGPLEGKVENYDEMLAFIGQSAEPEAAPNPVRRAHVPGMVHTTTHPILFAPIPGGPNEQVMQWMRTIDNGGELQTGQNRKALLNWMEGQPNVVALSAVQHPVSRAYDTFMQKIFSTGPNAYGPIRRQLGNHFEVSLPDPDIMENATRATLDAADYALSNHRAAFHAFLRFLKSNLAEQTSIRIDGTWATQNSFLSGFNEVVPISVIAKQGQMGAAFQYVETMLGIEASARPTPVQPTYLFSLEEVYTRQTENLTRKAYASDYIKFGFENYQAALDI